MDGRRGLVPNRIALGCRVHLDAILLSPLPTPSSAKFGTRGALVPVVCSVENPAMAPRGFDDSMRSSLRPVPDSTIYLM